MEFSFIHFHLILWSRLRKVFFYPYLEFDSKDAGDEDFDENSNSFDLILMRAYNHLLDMPREEVDKIVIRSYRIFLDEDAYERSFRSDSFERSVPQSSTMASIDTTD